MANMIHCQLWMGSVEPYMTESFIMNSFKKMGENPQSVKVMKNKFTGEPAGYCFVHFQTDEMAIDAMHKLNGKPIPGTNPVVRFRLNSASTTGKSLRSENAEREFSVWVGDLSPDVDDYGLYRTFSSRYTIKSAKVILDNSGFSKGFGFVRFGSEEEQKDCLTAMNGYVGLGSKPLKICNAVPKSKETTTATASPPPITASSSTVSVPAQTATDPSQVYSQYYDYSTYWQNYAAWQGYYEQGQSSDFINSQSVESMPVCSSYTNENAYVEQAEKIEDELELVEPTMPIDVDKLNWEQQEQDKNLWDSLESSKWLPCDDLEICSNNNSF